jgi:hypothetical protein
MQWAKLLKHTVPVGKGKMDTLPVQMNMSADHLGKNTALLNTVQAVHLQMHTAQLNTVCCTFPTGAIEQHETYFHLQELSPDWGFDSVRYHGR